MTSAGRILCLLALLLPRAAAPAGDAMELLRARDGARAGYLDLHYHNAPLERVVFDLKARRPGVDVVVAAESVREERDLLASRLSLGPLAGVPWDDAVHLVADALRLDVDRSRLEEGVVCLRQARRFTGVFDGVRLGEAVRLIAERGGANVVVSPAVDAARPVYLTFTGVPWRDALRSVLKAYECAMEVDADGTVVRVVTLDEARSRTETIAIPLRHLRPDRAAPADQPGRLDALMAALGRMASNRDAVLYDAVAGAILVTDTPDVIDAMRRIVETLDQPPYQVVLEASVVTMEMEPHEFLDATWTVAHAPADCSDGGWEPVCATHGADCPTIAAARGEVAATFSTGTMAPGEAASVLRASLVGDAVSLIQAPQMTVVDREAAAVSIGSVKPAKEGGAFTGTRLSLVPRVCGDGDQVLLDVVYEQCGDPDADECRPAGPDARTVRTTMLLHSGETGVIAGLIRDGAAPAKSAPLWKRTTAKTTTTRRHTVVLITPVLVAPPELGKFEAGVASLKDALTL